MTASDEDPFVCIECIGDKVLLDLVLSHAKAEKCAFCDKKNKCVPLQALADKVHDALQENFYLTSSEPEGLDYLRAKEGLWERPGEQVHVVISNIAKVSEELGEAIRDYLSEQLGHEAVRNGEENPYADDALYEEKGIDDWGFRESWDFFKSNIKTRARFFSQHAQQVLDEIFDGLGDLRTIDGVPVIRQITPTDKERYFFRARVGFSETDLKRILIAPVKELGPPPSRKATAGRMNAAGISVFYGAMNGATCIAEARAPVGSCMVLGRFEVIRTIRVLDFDALEKVYIEGSYFDRDYHARLKRTSFLRRLVQEIAQPVMPRDEEYEYLPTQAVSEYLAEHIKPRLDGIVFHSSQTGGEGRNVVLFHHASRVEPYELPKGTFVDVNMGWSSEDDYDDDIAVFERVPAEKEEPLPKKKGRAVDFDPIEFVSSELADTSDLSNDSRDYRKPVLRLDVSGIRVLRIKSVRYEEHERHVSRHRSTNDKSAKF